MLDLTHTPTLLQTASAVGVLFCSAATASLIAQRQGRYGGALEMAKASGFLGAKATSQLLPQHHAAVVDGLQVVIEVLQPEIHSVLLEPWALERTGIVVMAEAKAIGRSGTEMEAMMAVSVAALELFALMKDDDPELEVGHIKLVEKKGRKKKFFNSAPVCAVLVCSDSTAAGKREDNSGKIIKEMLQEANAQVKYYQVLPDEKKQIQQQIRAWVAEDVQFIFTTGGTGLGPRDNTVEAVRELLERDADGIAEAMRAYGQMRTPLAMMSRGVAGSIGQSLVVTLPGSSNGARESLEAILPAVFHARKMMKGGGH